MKRISHPYTVWEDYQAGMWTPPVDLPKEVMDAGDLLGNPPGLAEAMRDACTAMPRAAEHNLTNDEQNRRAWLGQAACLNAVSARRDSTCAAWGLLSQDQRDEANAVADMVIREWEASRRGSEALFS